MWKCSSLYTSGPLLWVFELTVLEILLARIEASSCDSAHGEWASRLGVVGLEWHCEEGCHRVHFSPFWGRGPTSERNNQDLVVKALIVRAPTNLTGLSLTQMLVFWVL